MKSLYVYDDEGTFVMSNIAEFESEQEAALNVIEAVIDWTQVDGGELYSDEHCQTHVQELTQLKSDVKGHAVDVLQQDWFESLLGFTFSVKE